MRLIAKRDFRNPERKLEIEDAKHPDHIHKGAIFNIGDAKAPFKGLGPSEQKLVTQLNGADCIADATDEKTVAAIMDQVAEEEKVAARQAAHAALHASAVSGPTTPASSEKPSRAPKEKT
jgi:hypothetical protein